MFTVVFRLVPALALAGVALMASSASAQDRPPPGLPLWEVGVVGGGAWLPDYPAADQNHMRGLVLPFIRYRGEILRSDEKGILRGRLFHNRDVELDISLNGSFPADADRNDARRGMPDLDWLGEVGPRLQWTMARAAGDIAQIQLDLPLRSVWSTDFSSAPEYRGVVFHPELSWQHRDILKSGMRVKLGLGPVFGSEKLMDMFYGVAPQHVTATRPQYDAQAGYMGSNLTFTASRALTPWVNLIGRMEGRFHQGATNSGSPLFRDDTGFSAGMALSFTMAKSKTQVPADR